MQYTFIDILDKRIIIDVKEASFINTFLKTKEMPLLNTFNEEKTYKQVVYGAILYNETEPSIDHFQRMEYMFAYPVAGGYNQLSIIDIHLLATMVSGGLTFTPFAALVESDTELTVSPEAGISAFLRYDDMDILTNLINRECIYAIREIETQQPDSLNWRRNLNEEHLLKVALEVK